MLLVRSREALHADDPNANAWTELATLGESFNSGRVYGRFHHDATNDVHLPVATPGYTGVLEREMVDQI